MEKIRFTSILRYAFGVKQYAKGVRRLQTKKKERTARPSFRH
jgi:hypothetical protein